MLNEDMVENINVEKRSAIKNALIKGALFGGAVIGASSIVNASSVFWRTETGEMIDLKSGQSIKHTTSFERTWTTGDSVYVKLKSVFLANESFVRVYANGVLYPSDGFNNWEFNLTDGKRIGSVGDLTDGIKLLNPVDGVTYRVEFDEYVIPFNPSIALCRNDNKMITKGLPRNCINGDGGKTGILTNISEDDPENFEYTFNYTNPDTFSLKGYYANRFFCSNFRRGDALPAGWRIEVYKWGRHWSGTRKSAKGSYHTTMNSALVPRYTLTTNIGKVEPMLEKKRGGIFMIRLRNTNTNEVSLFSIQKIRGRRWRYVNRSFNALGTAIFRASLY